jgi:hypothetical protein
MGRFGHFWVKNGKFNCLFKSAESITFVTSEKPNIILSFDDFTNYFSNLLNLFL